MRDAALDCAALKKLCEGLDEHSQLTSLDLARNFFEEEGFTTLLAALQRSMVIEQLEFEDFELTGGSAKALVRFLQHEQNKLTRLALNSCDLSPEHF